MTHLKEELPEAISKAGVDAADVLSWTHYKDSEPPYFAVVLTSGQKWKIGEEGTLLDNPKQQQPKPGSAQQLVKPTAAPTEAEKQAKAAAAKAAAAKAEEKPAAESEAPAADADAASEAPKKKRKSSSKKKKADDE